jgi:hypothetical protein
VPEWKLAFLMGLMGRGVCNDTGLQYIDRKAIILYRQGNRVKKAVWQHREILTKNPPAPVPSTSSDQ